MIVTHINSVSARDGYNELLSALGTENVPDQWMQFMEAVEKHLPVMSGSGRPTKQDIERSLIGQLGFASWVDLVETPVTQGGLGWSINTWKLWVKAWKQVKSHFYLRQSGYTASMIMKLSGQFDPFPVDAAALATAIAENKAATKTGNEQKLADQQGRIVELEQKLLEADLRWQLQQEKLRDVAELESQLAETDLERRTLQQKFDAMADKVRELAQDNQRLVSQLYHLEQTAKEAQQPVQKPSGLWGKLRALLAGK